MCENVKCIICKKDITDENCIDEDTMSYINQRLDLHGPCSLTENEQAVALEGYSICIDCL